MREMPEMCIELSPELRVIYPRARFGSLTVRDTPNTRKIGALEERKRLLERQIRDDYPAVEEDNIIQSYATYFKRWEKMYPIEFQIKTLKKGGRLPQVSALVDGMFMAELKNRILTSGHDLDALVGDLSFDVSGEGESYVKLNGEEQMLKGNDVILRDEEGILASILYGPARRTSISPTTRNAIYFAWCPYGMGEDLIRAHLNDILSNLRIIYESISSETQILG